MILWNVCSGFRAPDLKSDVWGFFVLQSRL